MADAVLVGMADAVLIKDLAAKMCRAPMPSQALFEAAQACSRCLPDVVFVGFAIMTHDKQSVRYAALLSRQQSAPLASAPSASTAAGLAICTKQAVNISDIGAGDLGMVDLQYLGHTHKARSYFAAPVVVSQSAIGALTVVSAAAHAFTGQEQLLHTIAAMCAPYITLMTSNLAAVEGLLKQVLPVRVALQLREQELGTAPLQQQDQAAQPATAAGVNTSLSVGAGSSAAAAAATAVGQEAVNDPAVTLAAAQGSDAACTAEPRRLQNQHQQQEQQLGLDESSGNAHSSTWSHTSRWQRQRPLRSHQLRAEGHAVQPQRHESVTERQQQQQQDFRQSPGGTPMGLLLTFKQPQLELAYRTSVCLQWQQLLDALFVLLAVISAIGGQPKIGITGDLLVDTLCLLVLMVVGWAGLQQLHALPTARYLQIRVPVIAAIRLLRLALFVGKARYLPPAVFARPRMAMPAAAAAGAGTPVFTWSDVEVAGCGMLVMLGLSGQLPLVWHAFVQFLSFIWVFGTLHIWALEKLGGHAFLPWLILGLQATVGWGLPVAVVALVEWHTRMAFLHKIR